MTACGWKEGTKKGAVKRERRDQNEKSQLAEYINVDGDLWVFGAYS